MNGQELYDGLKDALAFFNIRFHDMSAVHIQAVDGAIIFTDRETGKSVQLPCKTPYEPGE